MYQPAHFKETRTSMLHELIVAHPLATLVAAINGGLSANHLPLLLDPARGEHGTLIGHIARANDLWRELPENGELLAIFQGADHYISPGWYPSKSEDGRVVPTWNYAVVHARGRVRWKRDPQWLLGLVTLMTQRFEVSQPTPWQVSDAPADYVEKLLDAIVGFEIPISELSGKWKVSQNKSAADRAGIGAGLNALSSAESLAMAALVGH